MVGVPENKNELDHIVILKGKEFNDGIVGLVRWWWSKRQKRYSQFGYVNIEVENIFLGI